MQRQIRSKEEFIERTDALSNLIGVPLRQLGPHLKLSPASLFGYRSGKIPLSDKAWSKLEASEQTIKESRSAPPDCSVAGSERKANIPGVPGLTVDGLWRVLDHLLTNMERDGPKPGDIEVARQLFDALKPLNGKSDLDT